MCTIASGLGLLQRGDRRLLASPVLCGEELGRRRVREGTQMRRERQRRVHLACLPALSDDHFPGGTIACWWGGDVDRVGRGATTAVCRTPRRCPALRHDVGRSSACVQFLSDPVHRTVLWEVSLLGYPPGLADRLTTDHQSVILVRGRVRLHEPRHGGSRAGGHVRLHLGTAS
jgi:hypothetical protein